MIEVTDRESDSAEPWLLELGQLVRSRNAMRESGHADFDHQLHYKLGVLLSAEKCTIANVAPEYTSNGTNLHFMVCALEYDLFARGYTAYRSLSNADINEVFEFLALDPEWGVDVWLCKHANRLPLPEKLSAFTAHGWVMELHRSDAGDETLTCTFNGKPYCHEWCWSGLQTRTEKWFVDTFGRDLLAPVETTDRANRFFEEALEVYQSLGAPKEAALQLLDYVYAKPAGDAAEEVGDAVFTLSLLSSNIGLDFSAAWVGSLAKAYSQQARIAAKDKASDQGSPLPGNVD